MKILATSDWHGYLPTIKEPFDLLCVCGDICPANDHRKLYQDFWLRNSFVNWINSLPFAQPWSKIIYVPGNHDFVMENMTHAAMMELQHMTNGRLIILRHDVYNFEFPVSDGVDSLTIFGTPYCSQFGHWAFMHDNERLDRYFGQIPENVDILLSHDSPNIHKLGAILEGEWKSDFTGNSVLPKHIERVKPKMFFSGHFHSGNHSFEERDGVWMANVSYVDEDYYPRYPILEVKYNEETRTIENGTESDS